MGRTGVRAAVRVVAWVAGLAGLTGLVVVPAAGPAGAGLVPTGGDTIALHVQGTAPNTGSAPGHLVFTVPVFSLVDGAAAGTLTDDITCAVVVAPPCTVFDIQTTYHLAGGDIVSQGRWTGVPALGRPGFAAVGTRPEADTITLGNGIYTGFKGRVNGWGTVDLRALPAMLGYDIFTVIRVAGGGDRVLGTGDRLSTTPGPDRIPQYFHSDGENESTEPFRFVASGGLFSLGTAERFGGAIDRVTCGLGPPPCLVLDVVSSLAYDGGEMEVASRVDLVPDPQRPGFALFDARPAADNIGVGPGTTSGIFAGRTGRLLLSGSVDLRRFPFRAPFEGVALILLH